MQKVKSVFLLIVIFLFPLFFLTTTQEFFITNKFYFLAFGGLVLLLLSVGELFISKKIVWQKNMFDGPVVLFLLTVGLSIIIASPNKIEALVNPSFGFVALLSLTVFYYYLSRETETIKKWVSVIFSASSFVLSIITIIFFFQPFRYVTLPTNLQFLKSPGFNLFGNQIDLGIMLGFFILYQLMSIVKSEETKKKVTVFSFVVVILNLLALALTLYLVFLTSPSVNQPILLPPFALSWYAAVEVLKNPLTALFGVGVDNFVSMFTKVKDTLYNQSTLWQINSFTLSRSALLHIFTETGLFGTVSFVILVIGAFKKSLSSKRISFETVGLIFVLLMMALFPPSLTLFFLFFLMISLIAKIESNREAQSFNLAEIVPLYLGSILLSLVVIGVLGYFLGRAYVGEYYFKQALNGIVNNNVRDLYNNERLAAITNPYIEQYRINFSQANLLIANSIASRAQASGSGQLSDQDRQTIGQAIQAAINEAKAAVSLNPQKATNWENLAVIYRNIINVAQGADVWTVSAYQRAITLDPQNAQYRLNLGGVYYSLNDFADAANLFQQATLLKPDWANAHYNLAWASYQGGNYQLAVNEMQSVLTLINAQKDTADYQKAQKDLDEFKKKLPKTEAQTTPAQQTKPQLSLPTPQPTIEPKIQLPKEASPEAK